MWLEVTAVSYTLTLPDNRSNYLTANDEFENLEYAKLADLQLDLLLAEKSFF